MAGLYLTEQGSVLRKDGRQLKVTLDDSVLTQIPESLVSRVLIFGNVQITTQALSFLLSQNIDTTFYTLYGKLKGRLIAPDQPSVLRRLKVHSLYQNQIFEIGFAKRISYAKIRNSISILNRSGNENIAEAISTLNRNLDNLDQLNSIEEIMGVEGFCARVFFSGLKTLLDIDSGFTVRERPARDPVNSCLNLGYTILTSETFGALYSAGFDPYVGVVHAVLPGRPALALDMIEEFRHIIDRLILALFNRRQLSPDKHFETDDANLVRLNADGRRVFFTEYERIMNRPVRAIDDSNSPPRRRLHEQVEIFAETVMSEVPYRPFIWNE